MTTEHDMAVAMATEIGKQVPVKQVYEDVGSPAARQVGFTLEDVVKCIRLVGLPLQAGAILQDRLRAFMERVAKEVPADRRVLPAPQILGPILEGIRYELDDTPIVDMFANLLGAAMDADRASGVFPYFPSVVKVLSPDEAKILKYLTTNHIVVVHPIPGVILMNSDQNNMFFIDQVGVRFPNYSNIYFDHLFTLGLLGWNHELQGETTIEGKKMSQMFLRLSPLGKQLMEVCLPPTPRRGTP